MSKRVIQRVSKAEAVRIASQIFGRNVAKCMDVVVMGWYTFRVGLLKLTIDEFYDSREEGAPHGTLTLRTGADCDDCTGYTFTVTNSEIVATNYYRGLYDQLSDKLLRATQVTDNGELVITSKTNLARAIDIANGDYDDNSDV